MLLLFFQYWMTRAVRVEPVPYDEFERYLANGRVAEVVISDQQLVGKLKKPEGTKTAIVTTRAEPEMADRLSKYGVKFERVVANTVLRDLLSWIVPALVFFGL